MIYTYIFSLPTRCISYATRIRYIGFCLFWWTLAHPAAAQFTTLTSESLVNTTTSGDQWTYWWSIRTIAVQPSGGFIGVWIDHNGTDGQGDGIYCQRFDANGTKIGAETLVNTTTTGDQFSPA